MVWLFSLFIPLGFCFTSLASTHMESLWQMTSGLIPGMSVRDHANMSVFFDKLFEQYHLLWVQAWTNSEGSFRVMWVYSQWLWLFFGPAVGILRLGRWVGVCALAELWLLLIRNLFLLLIQMRVFIRVYLRCFLRPAWSLLSYCSNCSGHRLVTPYIGHFRWYGVLQQLMMGSRDCSHHVDPWPPKNGIVGGWDVQDTELCDNIEWICTGWELNMSRERASFPSNL